MAHVDSGELDLQIMGEPLDHPGAPAFGSLPGQDVPADGPVEEYKLPADGKRSPDLGILDTALQVLQQFR
jgi:hypothetical protein